MAAATCVKCGGRMSADVAVCPHCAARQPGRDPSAARKGLSGDEIRALLATDATTRAAPAQASEGLLATLVLPHPATTGRARAIELALTVACAPLILAGTIAVGLRRRATRAKLQQTSGETMPVFVMTLFGALPLDLLLDVVGFGGWTRLALITGSIAGLCVRGILRSRATSTAGDLLRLDRG